MNYPMRIALRTLLVAAPAAIFLHAQEPRIAGAGTARGGPDKVPTSGASAAAIAGSKEDPAAVERGGKLFVDQLRRLPRADGARRRRRARLVRSILVLDDEKGILIAPVLRNGRPDQGMPQVEPDRGADRRPRGVAARADLRRGPSLAPTRSRMW